MKTYVALGAIAAGGLLAPQIARAVIIDSFDVGSVRLSADQYDLSKTVFTQDTSILGGERDVKVEWKTTSSAGTAVTAKINAGNSHLLAHGQESGAYGRTTVVWDGIDGVDAINYTGLNRNFTSLSVGGFNFDLISADLNGALRLDVYSGSSRRSSMTYYFPSDIVSPGQHLFFPLTSFSVVSGSGADWTNVGAIVLTIDGWNQQALDLRIDQFDTTDHSIIPEPVSANLLLIGLTGWLMAARKHRS